MTQDHIDIRPGVGAINAYRYMDTNEWFALAELVDNSIASWENNKQHLTDLKTGKARLIVDIRFDPIDRGRIKVWDNAGGINTADFQRAFKPGAAPDEKTSLSRYGLGMKMASIWFADNWKVTTTAFNEEITRIVEFDVPEIIRTERETVEPRQQPRGRAQHGTEVELWNLRRVPQKRTVGKMRDYLTEMYRGFIRSGEVEILWNDEPLVYEPPSILVAPYYKDGSKGEKVKWAKPLVLPVAGGRPIEGRAILFGKGKQAEAGLNLFWRGRLIKGNLDPQYKPAEIFPRQSFINQRLQIDLHLNDFDPTFDKKDFAWNSCPLSEGELLSELKKALKEPPLDILGQAENYRAKEAEPKQRAAAKEAISATVEAVGARGTTTIEEQIEQDPLPDEPLPEPERRSYAGSHSIVLQISGQIWRVKINLSERPQDSSEWLDITGRTGSGASEGSRHLEIRISLNHPFTLQYGTNRNAMDILMRMGAALAIAEITAREAGETAPVAIRRNVNDLLRDVLADA